MSENYTVDIDSERVLLDGAWYSREDLAHRIKAMVDAGDFKLGRPSGALEQLETALAELTTMTIKLPRGILNALSGAANRSGKSVEALARELIQRAIAAPSSSTTPIVTPPLLLPNPGVAVEPIALTAPPRSAAAAPEVESVEPIALTPKKAADPAAKAPATEAEKSWFNRR